MASLLRSSVVCANWSFWVMVSSYSFHIYFPFASFTFSLRFFLLVAEQYDLKVFCFIFFLCNLPSFHVNRTIHTVETYTEAATAFFEIIFCQCSLHKRKKMYSENWGEKTLAENKSWMNVKLKSFTSCDETFAIISCLIIQTGIWYLLF